jgi:hypothetical protein
MASDTRRVSAPPSLGGRRSLFGRVRPADEGGQVLVITALAMVLMLCCAGLVVDVGHAMLVQRQLQAGVDAAALAGVQHLPDVPTAEAVAEQYSASPGSKNAVNTVDNAVTTAKVSCLAGVPGCNRRDGGVNGITVSSSSSVPTWFGRIIGIKHLKVSATAVACSPCSIKPLDIMLVLDRTGSMCQVGVPPVNQPKNNCTDLNAARAGMRTFLSFFDPTIDKIGLALTPPAVNAEARSKCPSPNGYLPWDGTNNPNPPFTGTWPATMNGRYNGYDQWWHPDNIDSPTGEDSSYYVVAGLEGVDPLPADDYLINDPVNGWVLNPASALVQRLGCTGANGTTSYSLSIEEAQRELSRNGRGNVQDVIIFLSDGGANTSPSDVPNLHWTNNPGNVATPCGTGVQAAANAKGAGTIIYTIGYDLAKTANGGVAELCRRPDMNLGANYGHASGATPEACGTWGTPPNCDAEDALMAMASLSDPTSPPGPSNPPNYYYAPLPQTLNGIFVTIARDIGSARSRLIDNTSPVLP